MEERPFSDISFKEYLNEDKLMGSRCKKCQALYAPPRPLCIKCGSTDMEWTELKGDGKLAAFTSIYVGPPAMVAEGFDRKNPYISSVVELDEGVKLDSRIDGIDATRPEEIKIGTPLTAKFQHSGEGEDRKTTLLFEPK